MCSSLDELDDKEKSVERAVSDADAAIAEAEEGPATAKISQDTKKHALSLVQALRSPHLGFIALALRGKETGLRRSSS